MWTKSDKAMAEVAKINAETDKAYIDMGAASAEEIREHRVVHQRTDAPQDRARARPT